MLSWHWNLKRTFWLLRHSSSPRVFRTMAGLLHSHRRQLAVTGESALEKFVISVVPQPCCHFLNFCWRAIALSSSFSRGVSSSSSSYDTTPCHGIEHEGNRYLQASSQRSRSRRGFCVAFKNSRNNRRGGYESPDASTHSSTSLWNSNATKESHIMNAASSTFTSSFVLPCNTNQNREARWMLFPWKSDSYRYSSSNRRLESTRSSTATTVSRMPVSSTWSSSRMPVSSTWTSSRDWSCSSRIYPNVFCFMDSLQTAAAAVNQFTDACCRRYLYTASAYWGEKLRGKQYTDAIIEEWKTTFSHLREYDNESLQAWRRVFDAMDRDSDGYLSQADLQKTPDFTLAKAQKLREYDADQNNLIDFGEFVKALYNVDKEMFLESFEGFDPVDIQLEFDKYSVVDEASPTKKQIPESRIEMIMQHNKFTCITAPDIKRLFKELDVNGDGVIDFADFQQFHGVMPYDEEASVPDTIHV